MRPVNTIVGMSSPTRISETIELASIKTPPAVWEEIDD